jgi:hypothetical protein
MSRIVLASRFLLGPKLVAERFQTNSTRHRKGSDVVRQSGLFGRDEIGERPAELITSPVGLLTQKVEPIEYCLTCFIGVQLHVIAYSIGREEAVDAPRDDQIFLDDPIEEGVGLSKDLARLGAVALVLQYPRINTLQPPSVKKRAPINKAAQFSKREIVQHTDAYEGWRRNILAAPYYRSSPGSRRLYRNRRLARSRMCLAQGLIIGKMLGHKRRLVFVAEQTGRHRHCSAGVQDVDYGLTIVRCNLDGSVGTARRCTPN